MNESRKITDFFGGKSGGSSSASTKCPICRRKVGLRQINHHLDSECAGPAADSAENEESNDNLSGSSDSSRKEDVGKEDVLFGDSDDDYLGVEVAEKGNSESGDTISSPFKRGQKKSRFSPLGQFQRTSKSPKKSLAVPEFKDDRAPAHVPLTQSKRSDPNHVPYYLVNFEFAVACVIEQTDDFALFDSAEVEIIQRFRNVSLDAKKLFVRLFQRKFAWLQQGVISYDEIGSIQKAIGELVDGNFLQSGQCLTDLETTLKLLPAPALKNLAKEMNLACKGSKQELLQVLLKHSQHKSLFKQQNGRSLEQTIQKRALQLLGGCVRLAEEPRRVFLRVLSLYSLSNWWTERENDRGGQPQQLTTMLLVNQGKLVFPKYPIVRRAKLFRHRADLLRFEEACALEARVADAIEAKDWDRAVEQREDVEGFFRRVLDDRDLDAHVRSLPGFLRRFTSGAVIAYALTKCVEVLERLRRHSDAVDLLRTLIEQNLYIVDYRGHWFERLALDLDMHVKRPKDALDAIMQALQDSHVREGRKLALCQRVMKICNAKMHSEAIRSQLSVFCSKEGWVEEAECPKVTIAGRLLVSGNNAGGKTSFVFTQPNGDSLVCSVEELVRLHYETQGFPQGVHGEGAVVNTVAFLLFWDIVYDSQVDDAFRSPNQGMPLDMDSDDFYLNRKEAIDARLKDIELWSDDDLREFLVERWNENFGSVSGVSWELFRSFDHFLGLVMCFKRCQLRGVVERVIKKHRHTRSGFPDLTVWNPASRSVKIIEVKGPNDRLSTKQILWLGYLNDLGIDAFVCHVEATGARKLALPRKSSPAKANKTSPKKTEGGRTKRKRRSSEEDFM